MIVRNTPLHCVGGTCSYQCILQVYDAYTGTKYCRPDNFALVYVVDSIPVLCCCFYARVSIGTSRSLIQGAV